MAVDAAFHSRDADKPRPHRHGLAPQDGSVPLSCSVGIMAYNEEGNIANAVTAVLEQELTAGEITELIVVASGCSDRTPEIVTSLAENEPRLRLIVEDQRAGKASAINHFIAAAKAPILVLVNADNVVRPGAIDALVQHFYDPEVGMAGGHPVPVNDDGTFLGYAVHLLWNLHDQIARDDPKLGEIVAFRNVLPAIPTDTAVDELSIQAMLTQMGYGLVYEPRAVVYNRGPSTVSDFLRQRRRIFAGHLHVAKQDGYAASTMSARRVARAIMDSDQVRASWSQPWRMAGTVGLEAGARALGYYDFLRRRPHHIWAAVATTKADIGNGASSAEEKHVLVFHLVDYADNRYAFGSVATRTALKRVANEIRTRLGPNATVSEEANGTIIAMLPGDRSYAENTATTLVRELAGPPIDKRRDRQAVQLACAVVTFTKTGSPLASSIPALAS